MTKNTKLPPNKELGFMYKKCSFRPAVVSLIALVPEFSNAIKSYKYTINNQSVFFILRDEYLKMIFSGTVSSNATNIMNSISKDLFGDRRAWRKTQVDDDKNLIEVKFASRNGTFSEFWLTENEIEKYQNYALSLPDAPEDL